MDSYEPIHTGHGYLPTDRPKLSVFMEDFWSHLPRQCCCTIQHVNATKVILTTPAWRCNICTEPRSSLTLCTTDVNQACFESLIIMYVHKYHIDIDIEIYVLLFIYLLSYCLFHFCFSFYNKFLLCKKEVYLGLLCFMLESLLYSYLFLI